MIFLGIGSNLRSSFGNKIDNINSSILLLKKNKIEVLKTSSFYESMAYPNKNDPKFINVIISIETTLSPEELMMNLLDIEKEVELFVIDKNKTRSGGAFFPFIDNTIFNFDKYGIFKRANKPIHNIAE